MQDRQVVVVGQGYVGLPLAIAASAAGRRVIGVDLDESRVAQLNAGSSPVGDISDSELQREVAAGRYSASRDFSADSIFAASFFGAAAA